MTALIDLPFYVPGKAGLGIASEARLATTTDQTSDLLFASFGRALVEQVRAGDAERDPVAFVARWVSVVRELDGGL